jgi:proline racemase
MTGMVPVRVSAVDAHVAGGVVRLVTSGLPAPRGRSMDDKARWLQRHRGDLCRALVLEPRGHPGVTLAVLCEPLDAGADVGVLFRRAGGFVPSSGHGLIGAALLACEEGLLHPRRPDAVVVETALGPFTIQVDAAGDAGTVKQARWTSPPAFVLAGALPVVLAGRSLTVDVAWGGAFFAIVDSEAAGLPFIRARWPEFARLARPIAAAVESSIAVTHPEAAARKGVSGVIFVAAPDPDASPLRCLVVWSDGTVDRSASGTGAAALLAVFDAMGFAADGEVQIEGLGGVPLTARVAGRTHVASMPAVRVEISAAAWTVARHEFVVDSRDPLRAGIDW